MESRRGFALPELFLGLLAIGVAVVLTAQIFAGTIHDARHVQDTISVTASAHVPISSNLVRWTLTVSSANATAAPAARRLRSEVLAVRAFLRSSHVPGPAIRRSVVTSEAFTVKLPRHRQRTVRRVSQELLVSTNDIDVVERAAPRVGRLIERGVEVAAAPLEYLSTELTEAKLSALAKATTEARRRADILVRGLGGKLGRMRSSSLGVYQIVPRDSTEVSDYGINDTSTREKDVVAVVTASFNVKR